MHYVRAVNALIFRIAPLLLTGLLALAGCVPALGQTTPETARVARVIDADTYEVISDARRLRVRLTGADAPEVGQPFGAQATDSVRALLPVGQRVTLVRAGTDLFGRTLGRVWLLDGRRLDSMLVGRGWAWSYAGTAYGAGPWQAQQVAALGARRGLWRCADRWPPVPPHVWRTLSARNRLRYRGGCAW